MRDYYAQRRAVLPPPKVKDETPPKGIAMVAMVFVVMFGIVALAGVMWLALWAIDQTTLLSFTKLMGLSGAYILFRVVDRTLFGIRQ